MGNSTVRRKVVIYSGAVLVALIINISVNKPFSKTTNKKSNPDFPVRGVKASYYHNSSTIQNVDMLAKMTLRRARGHTGIEFVMVLIPDIPATYTVESYANALFKEWNIGAETEGKGVLVLFLEDRQSVKVEVSYNLEEIFTDAFCGAYQDRVRMHFAGRFFGDVVSNLINKLMMKYKTGEAEDTIYFAHQKAVEYLSGGGGVTEDDYVYNKKQRLEDALSYPPEVLEKYKSTKDMEEVFLLYVQSLDEGIKYPYLDLINEGSQFRRIEYPRPSSEMKRTALRIRKGFPYKIYQKGDLGGILLSDEAFEPFFMRRTPEGFWKIDMTKSWAYGAMNSKLDKNIPMYRDHHWMFCYPDWNYKKSRIIIPELLPFPENIEERISSLQEAIIRHPDRALNYFELADIYYWECYWITAAILTVEKGLELDPYNIAYRYLAIKMRYRHPLPEGIHKHYKKYQEIAPYDSYSIWGYKSYAEYFLDDQKLANELDAKYQEYKGNVIANILSADAVEMNKWLESCYSSKYLLRAYKSLIRTGRLADAEKVALRELELTGTEELLVDLYYQHRDKDSAYNGKRNTILKKLFPDGLEEVTLADFKGKQKPLEGVEILGCPSYEPHQVHKGDIVVAFDGNAVKNVNQWYSVRALSDDPNIFVILYSNKTKEYKEVNDVRKNRKFGCPIRNYSRKHFVKLSGTNAVMATR